MDCGSRQTRVPNAPHAMTQNFKSTRGRGWTFQWFKVDSANIKDDKCQMVLRGPDAWHTWTNKVSMPRSASSVETERNFMMRVAMSFTMHAGLKSQRELLVPMLATERVTEPQVDVDASPRVHCRRRRSPSFLLGHEKGTRKSTSCSTSREDQGEQVW